MNDDKYGKTPQQKLEEVTLSGIRQQVDRIKREWDSVYENNRKLSPAFDAMLNSLNEFKQAQTESISVSDAIERLRLELNKDNQPGSYYHAWQCNIAMCFYDRIRSLYKFNDLPMDSLLSDNLHKICNESAEKFLNLLCSKNNQ